MDRIRRPVKLGVIAHYAVLVLFIIGVLFPIGFIFMNTFKPTATIFTDPWSFPKRLWFQNYADAWKTGGIGKDTLIGGAGAPPVVVAPVPSPNKAPARRPSSPAPASLRRTTPAPTYNRVPDERQIPSDCRR